MPSACGCEQFAFCGFDDGRFRPYGLRHPPVRPLGMDLVYCELRLRCHVAERVPVFLIEDLLFTNGSPLAPRKRPQ